MVIFILSGSRGTQGALPRWVKDITGGSAEPTRLAPPAPWPRAVAVDAVDLVEAARRAGHHTDATLHVAALREAPVAAISPRQALLVGACEAMVAPDEEVPILFRRALELPQANLVPFELARVHLLYGERLRRVRNFTEARVELTSALDIFERLGAKPWASRARNELHATGQTRQRFATGRGRH